MDNASSDQRASEDRLKSSELRYRRLFETAQDSILILDAISGNIIDANPFVKKLLGYPQEELVGKKLWEIGALKDIASSKEAYLKLQTNNYIRYDDLPLETKDGRKIFVEFVSNVYMVGIQKVIQCNIRDITLQKNAEDKLIQEKTRAEAILASIGDGVIVTDKEGFVILMNNAAQRILGWKITELLGKKIYEKLSIEDQNGKPLPTDKRPITVALTLGKQTTTSVLTKYYYVRKDGVKFPAAITVTPVVINKVIIGAIEVLRDATQEEKLNRAKSEFVSLASHQLRTPLGIMKWTIETLKDQEYYRNAPENVHDYINTIDGSNERELSLVRDLLEVSRIDEGRVKNAPKLVDLVQVATQVVNQMQLIAQGKKIVLRLTVENLKLPAINIDELRFQEVLENLITNAVEYTQDSGEIEITIAQVDHMISIAVKDTGLVISSEDQKSIFTKFFRSQEAVKQNPSGSGLGLYVVKSYVEQWGGKVAVQSAERTGTTFEITIPISQTKNKEQS